MTGKKCFWIVALGLSLWSTQAFARGVVLDPQSLPPTARAQLLARVASARSARPAVFQQVAQAPRWAAQLDARKRGPVASITRQLKSLGPNAVLPMLEMLAVAGPTQGAMSDTAWLTLQVGLLETVGMWRDPQAEPVLTAILDRPVANDELDRAAAQALGRLGSDSATAKLVSLAQTAGPRQRAVLTGIGDCRRQRAAEALANLLQHTDEQTAAVIVRSLGKVGNAWAWKTPVVAQSGEGAATRAIAARALVTAFVAYDGRVRRLASKAILVVDDPSTPTLIRQARASAAPDLRAALDQLQQRYDHSPLRR